MEFGLLNIIRSAIEPAAVSLSDPLSEVVFCGLKKFADALYYENPFLDGISDFLYDTVGIRPKHHLVNRSVKIGLEVLVGSALGFLLGMSLLEIGAVLSIGVFSKLLTYAIKWSNFDSLQKQHAAHRCIKLAAGLLAAGLLVLVNPTFLVRLTPIGLFAAAVVPGIIGLSGVFIKFFLGNSEVEKTSSDEKTSSAPAPFAAIDDTMDALKSIKASKATVPEKFVSGLVVGDCEKNKALKTIQGGTLNCETVTQDNLASLSENGALGLSFCKLSDCACASENDRAAFLAQLLRIPNGCFVIKGGDVWACGTQGKSLLPALSKGAECIVISCAPGGLGYFGIDTMLTEAKKNAPESAQIFVVRNGYEIRGGTNVRTDGIVEYYEPCKNLNKSKAANRKPARTFKLDGENTGLTDDES